MAKVIPAQPDLLMFQQFSYQSCISANRLFVLTSLSIFFLGVLLYVPVSPGKYRLGGSALAQCYGQLGDCSPDLDEPDKLSACFNTTQTLIQGQCMLL